jgi:hypothetical protein
MNSASRTSYGEFNRCETYCSGSPKSYLLIYKWTSPVFELSPLAEIPFMLPSRAFATAACPAEVATKAEALPFVKTKDLTPNTA